MGSNTDDQELLSQLSSAIRQLTRHNGVANLESLPKVLSQDDGQASDEYTSIITI